MGNYFRVLDQGLKFTVDFRLLSLPMPSQTELFIALFFTICEHYTHSHCELDSSKKCEHKRGHHIFTNSTKMKRSSVLLEILRKFINSSNPIVCQYTYYTPKVNFKRQAGGKTPLYRLLFYIFSRENDNKSSVTHPFLKVLLTEN